MKEKEIVTITASPRVNTLADHTHTSGSGNETLKWQNDDDEEETTKTKQRNDTKK